jgi:molybdopterin-containing oxidoreductase family molybdopterin binding subunit
MSTMGETAIQAGVHAQAGSEGDDVWIPSACSMCYNQCGILAHVVDGTLIKIEGNPKSPIGRGRLCARGLSGIQLLYDPNRVNYPLRRTNPEKGIGVDPGWERISWDEALDTITDKLAEVRADNPQKLHVTGTVTSLAPLGALTGIFAPAFGTANTFLSDGHQCGNAEHILARTLHASITTNPDARYCDYLLVFGCQVGMGTYYALTTMAQDIADARARGMKLVVVDPYMSAAAEKADEWVPIKPGSDGALACALLNLLINEQGDVDRDYLSHHTDAPYLVGEDGHYLRDPESDKPLVWSTSAGEARPFDAVDAEDAALEGSYEWDGEPCSPVFELLSTKMAKWTPEAAEEVTSVPAETIRRIAREFGQAARIGSTITIDGHELPLRPAATIYFKGAHGHDNAWPTSLAIELISEIVGASNVPGGLLGTNPVAFGHPDTKLPRWAPGVDGDGLQQTALGNTETEGATRSWPRPPESVELPNLRDLINWPITTCITPAMLNDDRFSFDNRPAVLINYGANLLMSVARPEVCFEAFKDAFVISSNLYSDETAEALADIVLPDTCYLERFDPVPNSLRHHHPVGLGEWGHQIRQPVVKPLFERRHFTEVMREVGRRLGILDVMQAMVNVQYGLTPPHALDPQQDYTWEEIGDRVYRAWFGEERGLDWFREHGVITWPKQVEEVYWKPFAKGRAPIYNEWLVRCGEDVQRIADEQSLPIKTDGFVPLPDWWPCKAYEPQPGYDLQAIYYRVAWHTFSMTYEIPWLDEVSRGEPYSYFICINAATARDKGIADGDLIRLEAVDGASTTGRARLTEGIHPGVVAIANNGGHWARGMPIARGKGVFFNQLQLMDLEHTDLVSLTMDCDVRVRVSKVDSDAGEHAGAPEGRS